MEDTKRRRAYIYTTWLTKLLSGEAKCGYAAWYKTNHKYAKTPDDFPDRDAWIAKHDAITNRREAELIADGWTCRKEDAAEFILNGSAADLAGKPDLVAIKGDEAIVIDAKSGRPKKADHWQVLIYQFALPMTWLKGVKVRGEIERPDYREAVQPLGDKERDAIVMSVRHASGSIAPEAAPGPGECRYCDIANCQFRYKKPAGDARDLW